MTQAMLAITKTLDLSFLARPIFLLVEAFKFQAAVNETIKELSKLSDRELNDIGLARGDIYSVAHGDVTLKRTQVSVDENTNLKGWV
jgi:uncharacterized protein YjiS (DUF1127 family)